jgi:hypothetical protein
MALLEWSLDHFAKVRIGVADDCFVNLEFPPLPATLTDDLEVRELFSLQEAASISSCKSETSACRAHLLFLFAEVSLVVGHAVRFVSCKTDVGQGWERDISMSSVWLIYLAEWSSLDTQ